MTRVVYREWGIPPQRYWVIVAILAVISAVGGLAALFMEHEGHWVTGMTNQVVWGMPHVFAVFLIVAASGALNVASMGTVFGAYDYKPLGRLSGLLAIALLVGGLLILVLDLGRPERLGVAMTNYNFRSIFAWNIFLYTGFIAIVLAYLWTMVDRAGQEFNKAVGVVAFIWRLILTTGTGSIFGFLVARQAYDTAVLAPLFIALSLVLGLAVFMLVLMFAYQLDQRALGEKLLTRMTRLMVVFIGVVLLLVATYFLTKLYGAKNYGVVAFFLANGGVYTVAFWLGWVVLGSLAPIAIFYHPVLSQDRRWIAAACGLVILGGLSAMYVLIIGGQAFPIQLFPGQTIVESGFYDGVGGVRATYSPTVPETLLGLGGVAVAMLITAVAIRVLQFLPESLEDRATQEAA